MDVEMIQLDSKDEPWLPLRRIHGGPATTDEGGLIRSCRFELNSGKIVAS